MLCMKKKSCLFSKLVEPAKSIICIRRIKENKSEFDNAKKPASTAFFVYFSLGVKCWMVVAFPHAYITWTPIMKRLLVFPPLVRVSAKMNVKQTELEPICAAPQRQRVQKQKFKAAHFCLNPNQSTFDHRLFLVSSQSS